MINIINNNEWLEQEYKRYNKEYFNNELPKDIKLRWSTRMTRKAGCCTTTTNRITKAMTYEIALSVPYHKKYDINEIINTLVHEMIHVKYPKDHHGYRFKSEMNKLNRKYGLGLSIYSKGRAVVNYKYDCVECSVRFNRTNKIDLTTHRCSCGGKLQEQKVS